jgi:hypothetical protein
MKYLFAGLMVVMLLSAFVVVSFASAAYAELRESAVKRRLRGRR